jgi:hypothetical protein
MTLVTINAPSHTTSNNAYDPVVLATAARRGAEWLVASGIQMSDTVAQHAGGFPAWIDADTGEIPYVYAEISGYLVTYMCWQYARTGDQRFLTSARRAADWLIDSPVYHAPTGAFRCLLPVTPSRFDYKREQLYAFDCGVILNGLVDLYRADGSAKYLDASMRVADWLTGASQRADGSFRPVFDLTKNQWIESNQEWSLSACGYHTKISLGLANLAQVTKNSRYADAALAGCDYALRFQQPDGRFVTFPDLGGTNSHPHAYTAEGLWVVGHMLDRDAYLDASARATEWLFAQQSPDGYVPRHYHDGKPEYNERVDILSQALRLAELHRAEDRVPVSLEANMAKLVPVILRNQCADTNAAYDGAFFFGRLSDGAQMRHANVWVTSFATQALQLRHDRLTGAALMKPLYMV